MYVYIYIYTPLSTYYDRLHALPVDDRTFGWQDEDPEGLEQLCNPSGDGRSALFWGPMGWSFQWGIIYIYIYNII